MVYAQYGRTGVYQLQELFKMINKDEKDMKKEVEDAGQILDCLPNTNWFKMAEELQDTDVNQFKEAGIYDLFLHKQDVAFTIEHLYDWFHKVGIQNDIMETIPGFRNSVISYKMTFVRIVAAGL